MTTRRRFIQSALGGSALVSLSAGVPQVLLGASAQTELKGDKSGNILVVIQLSGGNDGINTVVPYGDDEYFKNRFTLAIGEGQVSKINDHVGLHPSLDGLAGLLDDNQLTIVQGVGYPNPNRSHFESMDLWHTAHRFQDDSQLGWLGRCLETGKFDERLPAIHYGGGRQPLALATRNRPIPSIDSLDQFRLKAPKDGPVAKSIVRDIDAKRAGDNPLLGFVHDSASVAIQTSKRLEEILDEDQSERSFPQTPLGRKLSAVAQMIESGLPAQIYYVTHEGFDTHSNQLQAHAGLLQELGDATQAFMKELKEYGQSERVAVMTFSEFGRRVRENASRGTDHGTAAPLFVCGGKVNSGLLNEHPSMTDLDQGDLKFSVDYRQVYATILEEWLSIDSQRILGKRFEKLDLFV